jgi:hypothetical protein
MLFQREGQLHCVTACSHTHRATQQEMYQKAAVLRTRHKFYRTSRTLGAKLLPHIISFADDANEMVSQLVQLSKSSHARCLQVKTPWQQVVAEPLKLGY